MIEINREVTIY
ncbi:hypothetical protein BLA29_015569 [Euroglyphus maynei]|uniref:Uncharacterized protein n=1 Tax=Euroglyphus maynei TaxID=6958 RepID=A0A1Y3B7D9_EURMA|nr:hypothetical protein BLA29_015569 [Euroglyphus maynei]